MNLASTPNYVVTLAKAASAFCSESGDRPPSDAVVNALVQAEKAAKQHRIVYPFEALQGRWRLCFTANRKAHERNGVVLGKGRYVPRLAPAHISFTSSQEADASNRGEINNQLQAGPILLKFSGPCRYLGKKNLLAFDFTRLNLKLSRFTAYQGNVRGGKAQEAGFYERSISKLPFFAFFLVTEEFIAARGRGGGLALWIRDTNET